MQYLSMPNPGQDPLSSCSTHGRGHSEGSQICCVWCLSLSPSTWTPDCGVREEEGSKTSGKNVQNIVNGPHVDNSRVQCHFWTPGAGIAARGSGVQFQVVLVGPDRPLLKDRQSGHALGGQPCLMSA